MKVISIVLCFSCFVFCSSAIRPQEATYIINLDGKKEPLFLFSDMFKSVKTIILETNKDCLIGLISKLQYSDNNLFILDHIIANSLFVFDKEGHFLRKIGRIGKGPGEYNKLMDFTIDVNKKEIFLLDNGMWIHKYKFDGTYISTIRIDVLEINVLSIQYSDNKLYAEVHKFNTTDNDFILYQINPENGKVQSKSLPVSLNKNWNELFSTGHSPFRHCVNHAPLYTQIFMDYIMQIDNDKVPYIALQSKNLTTKKDIERIQTKNPIEKFEKYKSLEKTAVIYDIDNYIEHNKFIYFEYHQSAQKHSVVYNTKTHETQIAELTHNNLVYRNPDTLRYIQFFDKQGVYDIPFPLGLDNLPKYIKDNRFVSTLDKLDQLKQLPEDSNPIIFYYEFKDE